MEAKKTTFRGIPLLIGVTPPHAEKAIRTGNLEVLVMGIPVQTLIQLLENADDIGLEKRGCLPS